MKILITNDDGIDSPGLHSLAREFEKDHEVLVVAPDSQRSACGHSITLNKPLFIKEVKVEGVKSKCYSVDGTPADCVKIAVEKILLDKEDKVDMVLSGINKGPNLGTDVIYSGTVSAAIEASIFKIPSVAISLDIKSEKEEYNYDAASKYVKKIVAKAFENLISENLVLNINVPNIPESEIKGIKVCELGNRIYRNVLIEHAMEDERIGYQFAGEIEDEERENTDVSLVKDGFITLTPLHYDLTNFKILEEVNNWFPNKDQNEHAPKEKNDELQLLAIKEFDEYTNMYRIVDFLNKSLKNKDIIFGLTRKDGKDTITIYDSKIKDKQ
jgi:5'-nucleotidase